jgi:hypothetical protein
MAKGTMVNFRLREEDVERIDRAAAQLGISRSDFIRRAVSDEVREVLGGGDVSTVGVRGRAKEKANMMDGNCPKNSYCVFIRDSNRNRICQTCGFKR